MPSTVMQRVRLLGDRQAVVENVAVPQSHGDEVVVRVEASALCGSDLYGLYRSPEGSAFTPGHEFAGEVVAVDRATRVQPGDRVTLHATPGCGHCRFCRLGTPVYCPYG